ncbi:MAG TPA: TonB-dependent receptor plug domain-containing protein, partial [Rhizorhapis sp.]|nr:TonB-dependent receptor plug domain-containing protein [Rhizorhapis sp.]
MAAEQGNITSGLEDIVVTARKVRENLQDTPIAITALSQAALEQRQMTNIASIDRFAPNVAFNTSSPISGTRSSASVFIRGVGQTDFTLTTDPGVGIYLDGVYIARSIGSVLDILDVERVEVLRGPQGTLFGRNTIGGAISLTSRRPGQKLSAQASVTTGSFDRLDVKASADIPITGTLSSSVSVARFTSKGYIDRPYIGDKTGGDNRWAGRIALAWTPSSTFRLDLSADGTRVREKSCCGELVAVYPGLFAQFHNAVIAPGLVPELGAAAFFNEQSLPTKAFQDNSGFAVPSTLDLWGVSASAEWDATDSLTAKSITAYRELDSTNGRDADHSPVVIGQTFDIYNSHQFSQEFQLLGKLFDNRVR